MLTIANAPANVRALIVANINVATAFGFGLLFCIFLNITDISSVTANSITADENSLLWFWLPSTTKLAIMEPSEAIKPPITTMVAPAFISLETSEIFLTKFSTNNTEPNITAPAFTSVPTSYLAISLIANNMTQINAEIERISSASGGKPASDPTPDLII